MYKQKRGHRTTVTALFAALMISMMAMSYTAYAEENAAEPGTAGEKSVTAIIPVSMEKAGGNDSYTVHIEPESANAPLPDKSSIVLADGASDSFAVTCVLPDTYEYTIRQDPGKKKGYTYDTTVYDVCLFVTEDDEGTLFSDVIINRQDSDAKSVSASFKNIPPAPTEEPPAKPTVTPSPSVTATPKPTSSAERTSAGGGSVTGSAGGTAGGGKSASGVPIQTGDSLPYVAVFGTLMAAVLLVIVGKRAKED